MPAAEPYLDTSALAKRYLDEVGSDDFDAFLGRRPRALISRLGVVELRCLLKPRCRTQEIDVSYERAALADFADDVSPWPLSGRTFDRSACPHGLRLDGELSGQSLRAVDALHLAIAQSISVGALATADLGMARAAEALGFSVMIFGQDTS